MYQNLIVAIDHGNRNMKTENAVFTSGLTESDTRPPLGEYMVYQGKYYTLTDQRIPYMRDKTMDDRFFLLTLFAIAKEAERLKLYQQDGILKVELPVGLPPKHYGGLYQKFEEYFLNRGQQCIQFAGHDYFVEITKAVAFPQDYAAAITRFQQIGAFTRAIVVDIGGFTLDYVMVRDGRVDLSVCDSLEYGVIRLYNLVKSRINSEYDILLEETDIDGIIRGRDMGYEERVADTIRKMTQEYVEDLLGTLRERGIDLKSACVVFVGGGSLLLCRELEASGKIGKHLFIEDITANAKGYRILYEMQKRAGGGHAEKE